MSRLWTLRETGASATALNLGGKGPDPIVGWEDAAVDPMRLGGYLREFQALVARFGYRTSLYGHFGDGCIHARINFELRTREGLAHWRRFLTEAAQGDARIALSTLELAAALVPDGTSLERERLEAALQRKAMRYDKGGEEHYNIISALHKSLRDSDPQAGLYWLARMLEAGEDPLYVARRLVRFASEDVGLADPRALEQAIAAQQAVHFIGMPEGALALAQAVVYLAVAPKSNALYAGYARAAEDARETEREAVPLHLRNAPTGLMRELGYGAGYRYVPDGS